MKTKMKVVAARIAGIINSTDDLASDDFGSMNAGRYGLKVCINREQSPTMIYVDVIPKSLRRRSGAIFGGGSWGPVYH